MSYVTLHAPSLALHNAFDLTERYKYILSSKPFPKRQILDSSKLKEFADDNFKFHENGRKSSKRVENTVGKR